MKKSNSAMVVGIIFAVIIVLMIGIFAVFKSSSGGKTTDSMLKHIKVTKADPVKAPISLDDNTLYDELPEIAKYPVAVQGSGKLDVEIFTSGEKAGKDNDSWLIDVAERFNNAGNEIDGMSVSMTVRSVPSGTAADYIISGKYLPDIYTPSNTLFGEYAIVNGGNLELHTDRLVGNTAGILVKKGAYTEFSDVISAVQSGQLNMGYTNPQTSATGLNLLLTLLKDGQDNFTKFNQNIPYVAYTTQQMRDSASNGKLDAILTEYQTYINDQNLTSVYDFIPFGMRHDNPAYICDKAGKTEAELQAIDMVIDYCLSDEMQKIATNKGFNANDDYKSELSFTGAEVSQGLDSYKVYKDNGKDIIAVFVADCSGSMSGDPMNQLKESLSNGMQYINENNYVGLVSYSNNVQIEVPIAQFDMNQKAYFQGGINSLSANGSTASYDAVVVAMDMIEEAKKDHPDAKPMIFLLSDGYQNVGYDLGTVTPALRESEIPVYTISYTSEADTEAMRKLSEVNEAATINADSDDIVYKIKSLFNSQM